MGFQGIYKEPAKTLEEDFKIRKFVYSKLGKIGIEKMKLKDFPIK